MTTTRPAASRTNVAQARSSVTSACTLAAGLAALAALTITAQVTTVSFVIQSNGGVRPDTLKVVKSSGQPVLDDGALNTIRAGAPFPPPREMEVTIGVANSAY
jgi:TonB family protein